MSDPTGIGMPRPDRPRVLFVDDENNVLLALARQVHGFVKAELATSPVEAARLLSAPDADFAAVVSDMRMPGMDGAELLKLAASSCPDATRVLLTGHADLESAVAAVNEGNIFRFLTKPCPTTVLRSTLTAAIEQHQLIRDRRELLEQTLRGSVEALVETLAMAHPEAFARASRLGRLTRRLAERLALPERWQVEVAARLGEIGVITLPPQALDALTHGTRHDRVIAGMLDALPDLADGVLRRIPRLEPVREIVRAQQPVDGADEFRLRHAGRAVLLLQAVREFDALCARAETEEEAVAVLRQRSYHDPEIIDALQALVCHTNVTALREVDVAELHEGMVLGADLRSGKGMLLVGRGQTLTPELLARIRNFASLAGLQGRPVVRAHS